MEILQLSQCLKGAGLSHRSSPGIIPFWNIPGVGLPYAGHTCWGKVLLPHHCGGCGLGQAGRHGGNGAGLKQTRCSLLLMIPKSKYSHRKLIIFMVTYKKAGPAEPRLPEPSTDAASQVSQSSGGCGREAIARVPQGPLGARALGSLQFLPHARGSVPHQE